eukprot:6593570-Prymnesium_polylepis.1
MQSGATCRQRRPPRSGGPSASATTRAAPWQCGGAAGPCLPRTNGKVDVRTRSVRREAGAESRKQKQKQMQKRKGTGRWRSGGRAGSCGRSAGGVRAARRRHT